GGSITLTTFTQETFQLFGVTTSNGGGNGGGNGNGNNQESEAGVFGLLSADAGSAFGNGGFLTTVNTGVGGLLLGPNQSISVAPAATGGNGGLINLQAPMGSIVSTGPGLSVNASTGGNYNGGQIQLLAEQFIGPNSGPFVLSARGNGDGAGGTINVTAARV